MKSVDKYVYPDTTMIRLLEKKYKDFDNCICLTYLGYSLEILDLRIKQLFSLIRIEADIDIIRDVFKIESIWEAQDMVSN